jgi:hypothetical protein
VDGCVTATKGKVLECLGDLCSVPGLRYFYVCDQSVVLDDISEVAGI